MSRFGATKVTMPRPSRFGAALVVSPEPATSATEATAEQTAPSPMPEPQSFGSRLRDVVTAALGPSGGPTSKPGGDQEYEAARDRVVEDVRPAAQAAAEAVESNLVTRSLSRSGLKLGALAQNAVLRPLQYFGNEEAGEEADATNRVIAEITAGDKEKTARGWIAENLGEGVARGADSITESLGDAVTAAAFGGPLGSSTKAMALYFGSSGADQALTEAEDLGLSGKQKAAYAAGVGGLEAVLMLAGMGVAKKLGLETAEQALLSEVRPAITNLLVKNGIKPALTQLGKGVAGGAIEGSEEALTTLSQEVWKAALGGDVKTAANRVAATLKDPKLWSSVGEAAATGVAARGAFGAANQLARGIQNAAKELPKALATIETKVSGRKAAEAFRQSASPESLESARRPLSQSEFAEVTGHKRTSQKFRESFRETISRPDPENAETAAVPPPDPTTTPDVAQDATEAPAVTEHPSTNATQQGAVQGPTEGSAPVAPQEPPDTSARKAEMARDRELLGLPETPTPETRPWATALDVAQTNGVPARAMRLAAEVTADPRPLSDVETAGMVVRAAELKNEHASLSKRLTESTGADATWTAAELDRVQQEFDTLSGALRISGTEKGRALASQKLTIDRDYKLVSVLSQAKAKRGAPLTPKQKSTLEILAKRHDELEARIARGKGTQEELENLTFDRDRIRRQINWEVQNSKDKTIFQHMKSIQDASRAIQTSLDLSAVARQGGFVLFSRPEIAAKSMMPMIRAAFSEHGADRIAKEIAERPNAKLYKSAKLFLHEEETDMLNREEGYASKFVQSIPGLRGSQRAYTTFLNKLRADTFDSLAATLAKNGEPTLEEARAIANYVNVATGRGGAGKFDQAMGALSTVFFAPRYVLSRFQLLAGQPLYGGTTRTKQLIAGEYARYAIGMSLVLSLANLSFGDEPGFGIELDPRSSDFLKMRFGKTRLDPLSGLQQAAVFTTRMLTGQTKTKGRVSDIRGPNAKYGSDAWGVATRFARSKLSPAASRVVDVAAGKNVVGDPVSPGQMAVDSVTPLSFKDIGEAIAEHGIQKGGAMALASLLGVGLQTYDSH